MSCLYSSPEVTSVELLALKLLAWIVVVMVAWSDPVRVTRDLIAVQFDSTQILPYIAVNKRRVPQQSSGHRWLHQSFRLPKQAQVFSVIFQAQYQAFVRFAVGSSAALSAIALN